MITRSYMDLSSSNTTRVQSYDIIIFTATCVLVTRPFWLRGYHHLNMALAKNLQFQFDSPDSFLMTYLQTICLSRVLGQSPGIMTRFDIVTQQEGVFILIEYSR